MSKFVTICRTEEIREGSGKMFLIAERQVGIFHINGKFLAIDNRCPHAGASLAHGRIEGETVSCRIHHWQFNIRSGQRLDEGCPYTNIETFPVRVVGNEVQIEFGDEHRSRDQCH